MSDFKTTTYGKWIFSGEHAVLRGGPALVFPLFKKKLTLEYFRDIKIEKLKVTASGENASDIVELFPGVLTKALNLLNRPNEMICGTVHFENELPLGSGLGASSSLCVAFSRWFCFLGLLAESDIYEFARQLENIFHGESSGVDIAVVLHEKPLVFKRPHTIDILDVKNPYTLYLSHTGQKGITKECVAKVNEFIKLNSKEGKRLDDQMIQATKEAIQLFTKNQSQSQVQAQAQTQSLDLSILIVILNSGHACFQDWGLTQGLVETHIDFLKSKGALAVKPTGSGGGGYVLSLWAKPVVEPFDFEMIPLFE